MNSSMLIYWTMLCQIMRLYNVEWDGKVIEQWILQINKLSRGEHVVFVGITSIFSYNTGGALGWHFTCFRSRYLSNNTREILSPCCVSFNQRCRIPSHTVRSGYLWRRLWCVTTNRLLMNVTLNAGWRRVAAVGVDGGWLGRMAAPLHMLRRFGRI
jgi:hypothetical protein